MTNPPRQPLRWRKSSYSGSGNNCVEVAAGRGVAVRDSKNPAGARLAFSPGEWRAFLIAAKAGRYDAS